MYHSTGVQKLSESQKSKLRNGHPVRIKQGSGNTLQLTDAQIKKLGQTHKRGPVYTIQMHPEQAEKDGPGIFGDIKKLSRRGAYHLYVTYSPIVFANFSFISLVSIFRCSSSTTNPVSVRRVDSSFLVLSLSSHLIINNNPVYPRRLDFSSLVFSLLSHRHSYISLLFTSRFIDSFIHNKHI
jgi:hypothetical protein